MDIKSAADVRYLQRPEGRIAYTVEGSGPLVVAVPGMGDLRSSYIELVPPLLALGYRVAVMDLRGHGSSDTSFHTHGDLVTADDLLALIRELGGPAVVLGNSMGAAAAAWAAADDPTAVVGLVLFGPLLREPMSSGVARVGFHALYRTLFAGPWGAGFWAGYYKRLNSGGSRAPWLDEHVAEIKRNLSEPQRLRSFRELALQLDHSAVEARLGEVRAPIRAFVGDSDPDFRDPRAESEWIAGLGAESEVVAQAGHYPHAQRPDVVVPATIEFLNGLRDSGDAEVWAPRA